MTVTYTAERTRRLINAKKIEGEYHVTGALFLRGFDLSGVTLPTSVGGWLDLSGCDLSGVTLPTSVGGWLDLSGCDLSGVTLPTSVGGWLDLSGCDLSGVTLPTSVGGWLDLSGCDLSGVTLPTSVGGWLDLSGCDLSGVTMPTSVTGALFLNGCRNPDPSQWWTERGEAARRRCIAVCPDDGYALVQTDTDHFSAGCRKNLTREQALAHWNRSDARAKLFTAAIKGARLVEVGDA